MITTRLAARVRRFYLYQAASSFALWIPFWALWIRGHLASDFELTLVDVAFWIGLLVFQLPVGVIADRYGRKKAILLSEAFRTVGILGYGLGGSFVGFVVANVVWSLGAAFMIGTSAYLYETLLEAGHEAEFPRYIGRNTMVQLGANAAGAFAGGILASATGSIGDTLIVGTAWNLACIGVAATFVEPAVPRMTEPSFWAQLAQGWHIVKRREGVSLLIGIEVVLGVTLYMMALFRPIYLTAGLGYNEAEVAIGVSGFLFAAALVSAFAGGVASRLGEFGTILGLVGLAAAGFLGMWLAGANRWAVAFQIPIYIAWTLQAPLTTAFLNRRLEPGQRATVLSMGAFAYTLVLVVVEPLVGLATGATGVFALGLALGVFALVPSIFILVRWRQTVAPWPAVTPVPSRLVPGAGRVSRFGRLFERLSRLKP